MSLPRSRPARAWTFVAISASLVLGACGDSSPESTDPQVVIEIQAPTTEQGATITQLDYEIACDTEWRDVDEEGVFMPATRRSGTMELLGPARATSGTELTNTSLWSAIEAPLNGLCLLNLIGSDEQERSICASAATFQAIDGETTVVDRAVGCMELAAFIGDLSLVAEAPEVVGGIELETVEFTVDCAARGTDFFEGDASSKAQVNLNGNLEVFQEPTGLDVQGTFGELPVGSCTVQLRARDEDGEVRCTANDRVIIAPAQTRRLEMVVGCDA
ncbi:MAG: hypothetical protein AAF436_16190 [Myxococcota bacterium]